MFWLFNACRSLICSYRLLICWLYLLWRFEDLEGNSKWDRF